MKQSGNCNDCPFYVRGLHAGYTGQSGPMTWSFCERVKGYIRELKSCEIAAQPTRQREEFIKSEAP